MDAPFPPLLAGVEPHGWYADITVNTTEPAYHALAVCFQGQPNSVDPADFNQVCNDFAYASLGSGQKETQRTFHADGLKPGTPYIYAALASYDTGQEMTSAPFSTPRAPTPG